MNKITFDNKFYYTITSNNTSDVTYNRPGYIYTLEPSTIRPYSWTIMDYQSPVLKFGLNKNVRTI